MSSWSSSFLLLESRKRRSFCVIFKRKKKKLENFNILGLINDTALPLTQFGEKITNSDVVLICIVRIASQCAKLKGRCIKRSEDWIITERNKNLFFYWSLSLMNIWHLISLSIRWFLYYCLMIMSLSIRFMIKIHYSLKLYIHLI